MKAILCSELRGDIETTLSLSEDCPKPVRSPGKGELLIHVWACSLAPGDIRVQSGQCDFYQAPKEFPYVPGGDICGIVEEADEDDRIKAGDCVAVMFEPPGPLGGLAEYAVVKSTFAEVKPKSTNPMLASCLPSSGLTAMTAVDRYVKKGDRVLVLGASGGVGTNFVQLARHAGASYIAATSTQSDLLQELGVDRVIDYNRDNWWEIAEFKENPFDIVFDLVEGKLAWKNATASRVLKRRGIFLAPLGNTPFPEIHGWWDVFKFQMPLWWRALWTSVWPFSPRYKFHFGLDMKSDSLGKLFRLVDDKKLKVVVDPSGPFPFTAEGVREAFSLQKSRHAHGKVVINLVDDTAFI